MFQYVPYIPTFPQFHGFLQCPDEKTPSNVKALPMQGMPAGAKPLVFHNGRGCRSIYIYYIVFCIYINIYI